MSIFPIVRPKELVRILEKAGFEIVRQKGSHVRLMHPNTGRGTTVPMHSRDLSRMLLSCILREAGISGAEFLRFLRE